jgi:uncharacterized protein YkwD
VLTNPRAHALSVSAALRPVPRSVRVFLTCAALVIASSLALPAGHAHAAVSTTLPTSTAYRASLLAGVNAQRTSRGLHALVLSSCANDTYAQPWSVYLAVHHTLVHQSMSHMLSGCHASIAAEDIGDGAVSASSMVAAWMASAPHRANILDPSLRYIGVGAAHSHSSTWYTVLDFTG